MTFQTPSDSSETPDKNEEQLLVQQLLKSVQTYKENLKENVEKDLLTDNQD